jgi:hypothetical protein
MPTKPKYPSQAQEQFVVRLPDGMRDRIAAAAKRNGRSMNAEIVHALEEAFPIEVTIRGDGFIDQIPPGAGKELLGRVARASELLKELGDDLRNLSPDDHLRIAKELKGLGARLAPERIALRKKK